MPSALCYQPVEWQRLDEKQQGLSLPPHNYLGHSKQAHRGCMACQQSGTVEGPDFVTSLRYLTSAAANLVDRADNLPELSLAAVSILLICIRNSSCATKAASFSLVVSFSWLCSNCSWSACAASCFMTFDRIACRNACEMILCHMCNRGQTARARGASFRQ